MADILVESLAADLQCTRDEARALQEWIPRWRTRSGADDDSEEDLIVRLREPASFGAFAELVATDSSFDLSLRRRVVEHAFDLLPLARGENDLILVPTRAPRRLLALASFLQDTSSFTVLHAMHLIYAVFLDRQLFIEVPRSVRVSVLSRLIRNDEMSASLRVFYAALHLASVGEPEAHGTFARLLHNHQLPDDVLNELARLSVAEDGGMGSLADLARRESLLSVDADPRPSSAIMANVPRLPSRLAALGRRWLLIQKSRPAAD